MSKIKIEITAARVESDPSITIYEVAILDKETGVPFAEETLGSEELLRTFLNGVKAGSWLPEGIDESEIPEIPKLQLSRRPKYRRVTP